MEMEDGGVGAVGRGHAGTGRLHPGGASLGIDEGHVARRCVWELLHVGPRRTKAFISSRVLSFGLSSCVVPS